MKIKPKGGWVGLALILSLIVGGLVGAAKIGLAQESPRVVRVGVYENKPKVYRGDDGQFTGLFPDLLNYIARQENWQIDYVSGSFAEGLGRLERGEIDIMVDVAVTAERAKKYDFSSETVMSSWGVVYVRKEADIDSFKDLDNKRLAILKQSVYLGGPEGVDQYIKSFNIKVEFVEVEEYAEVFRLLDQQQVDAAVVSRIFALANEKDWPNLRSTDIIFSPTELRFALTKGDSDNPYLIERLDFWVKKLKAGHEGVFLQILRQNNLLGLAPQREVVPGWVLPASVSGAAFLLLSWLLVVILRQARKRALVELKEKGILLGMAAENARIILFALDKEGYFTLAEGRALKMLGVKSEQMVGKSLFDLYKDNPVIIENAKRALKGEEVEFRTEVPGMVSRVTFTPVAIAGRPVAVIGIAIDLTEEARLDKAKMEFVSLASHHLRTPPTAIKWGMELLWPKVKAVFDAEDLQQWQGMAEANERMINLANSLSRSARMESGAGSGKAESFKPEDLVDEVIKNMGKLIEEKQIKVIREFQLVDQVSMDKVALRTIIETLISNAVKYSKEGGTVTVGLVKKDGNFVLEVKDTGIGIPAYQQDKVFSRLFRGDNAIKADPGGVGLALHMSKAIVDNQGGKIWFVSTENKGSQFFVELPLRLRRD